MRIALDATYSVGDHLSGVGVYSRCILRGLSALPLSARVHWLWCYRPHRLLRSFAEKLPANCSRRLLRNRRAPEAHLFHGLNQRLPSATLRRAVTTFHDLFVLTGDYSTPEFRRRFAAQAREAASRSDLIIAVSHFTAKQVEELLGVQRARIRVIHHGVSIPPVPPAARREPIVLFVGALQRRKNVTGLIQAFETTPKGWRLVLVGSRGYGAEEALSRVEASPRRADIDLPGYIRDVDLENLYARAAIFAFPSLDEGFGMPVLEAMARGIPVVTSNRSALPEVSGDAAMLVDPASVDEIAAALRRLIEDDDLREELSERGRQHSAGFRWETAAERTWSVYRELTEP